MTLGKMDQMLQELLQEFEGTDAVGDVFSRRRMIQRATDYFAQEADGFWYAFQEPVVNGQSQYCVPQLYKLRSINFCDVNGCFYPMLPKSTGEMDGAFGYYNWRNWTVGTVQSAPPYAVIDGMNRILLVPPPAVPNPIVSPQVAPIIEFEGYAIPSEAFQTDGKTPLFAALTDECPLNSACHPGIVYQAIYERLMQRPTPDNLRRMPVVERQRDRYLGDFCGFARSFTPPYRFDGRKYRYGY